MSQHDLNIANQGFPAFRADLNNALAALATNSSGAAAPATTYGGMLWYETDTQILWLRTSDNTAWVPLATVSLANGWVNFPSAGFFRGASQTPAAPTLSFTNSPDTGFYNPSTSYLAISTAGTYRAGWNSGGFYFHNKTADDTSLSGLAIRPGGQLQVTQSAAAAIQSYRYTSDGATVGFYRDATLVGTISVTTTATAYNTSSDYRLKTAIEAPKDFDPIQKLKALADAQRWYKWKNHPEKQELGWFAHELAEVEPDAVVGEKDAIDEEGNPLYQGRSDTRLIPTLVAALDTAVKRIEGLEARLTALGG